MTIFVNGERVDSGDARTVDELVRRHGLSPEATLVEQNGVALRRREWPERGLQPEDRIEILRVAAGG